MPDRPLLPGRTNEADFLKQVGFWFVGSKDACAHEARIQKFLARGLLSLRRHMRTDGAVTEAYELTDAGLVRLEEITDSATAATAESHREYLRAQARKNRLS